MGLQRCAPALLLQREPEQQALAAGGRKGVHREDLPLGILLPQLRRGHGARLTGAAETGGKAQIQNVLPLLQQRLKGPAEDLHVHRRRPRNALGPHPAVKLPGGKLVVGIFLGGAFKVKGQAAEGDAPLCQYLRADIAGGIRKDRIIAHAAAPIISIFPFYVIFKIRLSH